MMNQKLKLYVWYNVLCDYTPGIAFALAENAEEAVKQLKADNSYCQGDTQWVGNKFNGVEPLEYDEPMSFAMYGGG